jgi:hypothetical protein
MPTRGQKKQPARSSQGRHDAGLDDAGVRELKAWLLARRMELVLELIRLAGWTDHVDCEDQGDCWLIAIRAGTRSLAYSGREFASHFVAKTRLPLTNFRVLLVKELTSVGRLFKDDDELKRFASTLLSEQEMGGTDRAWKAALSKLLGGWAKPGTYGGIDPLKGTQESVMWAAGQLLNKTVISIAAQVCILDIPSHP